MHKRQHLPRLIPILSSISLVLLGIVLAIMASISIKLAIAQSQSPQPQAILTLGGNPEREEFTAQFAQTHSSLPIWISSGLSPGKSQAIFQAANISPQRLHRDRRAVDTVTNFTTLVHDFQSQQIQHVYLITSDYHMRRSKAIAFVVFGSRGIITTPVPVPSDEPSETLLHATRDVGRSLMWLTTGRTGASLNPDRLW